MNGGDIPSPTSMVMDTEGLIGQRLLLMEYARGIKRMDPADKDGVALMVERARRRNREAVRLQRALDRLWPA